jgi:glucose/arabinose dehydrogenase
MLVEGMRTTTTVGRMRRAALAGVLAATLATALGLLAGCTRVPSAPGPAAPSLPEPSAPAPAETSAGTDGVSNGPAAPVGTPTTILDDLHAPWSVVPMPDGSALVDDRDSGRVSEFTAGGRTRTVGTVTGVVHSGEGGLLGLAVRAESSVTYLYAYLTTAHDNRVVRMPLTGSPGHRALGTPRTVIAGIPKGVFHNGGRIAFGPDGMLYITTGDGTDTSNAQNLHSLGGKILRVTPTGAVPSGNPFPSSPVYSYGHRNPQGLAWDSSGRLWASEFGQDTWDELNIITPGSDYGWPIVEGIAHDRRFVDPVYQWHTDVASPSGIAIVDDTIFMASLRGQRLWVIDPPRDGSPVHAKAYYTNEFGRLRLAVAAGPHTLWLVTNNTDGRGSPKPGDDRILRVGVGPAQ